MYRSGPVIPLLDTDSLKAILARDEPLTDTANSVCFVPVRLGVHPIGSLGISGTMLPRQTLEAIGTLIAIAIEHARAVEQVGQTEAAREAEKLRTALLDAVTHALRTPLTSIKVSVTETCCLIPSLSRRTTTRTADHHQRGNRSFEPAVGEAAEMARLDAGEVELKIEPQPIDHGYLPRRWSSCRGSLGNREFRVEVAEPASPCASGRCPRAGGSCPSDRERQSVLAARPAITITAEAGGEFHCHQRG